MEKNGLKMLLKEMKKCEKEMELLSCFVNIIGHLTLVPQNLDALKSEELVTALLSTISSTRNQNKTVSAVYQEAHSVLSSMTFQ